MEVKINKEIRNYTESMFFGLSLRQFIFSLLACGVAVGLYFILRPYFGTETLSWVCIQGGLLKQRIVYALPTLKTSLKTSLCLADYIGRAYLLISR